MIVIITGLDDSTVRGISEFLALYLEVRNKPEYANLLSGQDKELILNNLPKIAAILSKINPKDYDTIYQEMVSMIMSHSELFGFSRTTTSHGYVFNDGCVTLDDSALIERVFGPMVKLSQEARYLFGESELFIKERLEAYAHSSDPEKHLLHANNMKEWDEIVDKSKESVICINFYADWSDPCKLIAPFYAQLAKENVGKLLMVKSDCTNSNPPAKGSLQDKFKIKSYPTFVIVKDGKEVERLRQTKWKTGQLEVERHCISLNSLSLRKLVRKYSN